jgi:flavin-dependent dehydrogenase
MDVKQKVAVAVIGAGPAGLAVALLCRLAQFPTAVISLDRPAPLHLPETLPAMARLQLETLDVWRAFNQAGFDRNLSMGSAWGTKELTERHSIYNPWGAGWYLDRSRFDQLLLNAATERGAKLISPARLVGATRERENWTLHLDHQEHRALTADFVVDASGRSSAFARSLGIRRCNLDKLISVAVRCTAALAHDRHALVESAPAGWWYSVPASDGTLALAYFTDATSEPAQWRTKSGLLSLLDQTVHTKLRVTEMISAMPQARVASTSFLPELQGPGWIAVGDAALSYDPLASQGLLSALKSGISAWETIHRHLEGQTDSTHDYQRNEREGFTRFLNERRHFYSMEDRWPSSPFWKQRTETPQAPN